MLANAFLQSLSSLRFQSWSVLWHGLAWPEAFSRNCKSNR